MTESGAILPYLARKSGKLMPHDLAGEAQVLRWSVAALSSQQVDGWLADRTFVATDDFTVADILMTHVLSAGSTDQSLLEPYAHVREYLAR